MNDLAPMVSVTHNLASVTLAYADLAEQYRDQAAVRALNRTATTVRAEAARKIGATYNIRIGAAKSLMDIRRATRSSLTALITASGRPIPIIEFDARQMLDGVSVKVKGQRKLLRQAFIATMTSGHRGVFFRVRGGGKQAVKGLHLAQSKQGTGGVRRAGRLPIEQVFSLSLPAAFTQKEIMDALLDIASTRFADVMAQEVRFIQLKRAA